MSYCEEKYGEIIKKFYKNITRVINYEFEKCTDELINILEVKTDIVIESYKIKWTENGLCIFIKGLEMAKIYYSDECGSVYNRNVVNSLFEVIPVDNINLIRAISVEIETCDIDMIDKNQLNIYIGYCIEIESVIRYKCGSGKWLKYETCDSFILKCSNFRNKYVSSNKSSFY